MIIHIIGHTKPPMLAHRRSIPFAETSCPTEENTSCPFPGRAYGLFPMGRAPGYSYQYSRGCSGYRGDPRSCQKAEEEDTVATREWLAAMTVSHFSCPS